MRYETGMSSNNLLHWGELEVLKEFIQNMVYSEVILGDKTSIDVIPQDNGLEVIISNTPSGFTKGSLLIGESTQAGVSGAPGNWGEGMKAAMCVGLRMGMSITLITNGFTVIPTLEPSAICPDINALILNVEDNDNTSGTQVIISSESITKDLVEDAIKTFAILDGITIDNVKKDIILTDRSNCIYVNGVKICDMKSIYGYNFIDATLINRDRTSVNTDKVKQFVAGQLSGISDIEMCKKVITEVLKNDTLLESQSGISESFADRGLWKRALVEMFGEKIALSTGGESDNQARYRKYNLLTNVPVKWSIFFKWYLDIPESSNIELPVSMGLVYSKSKDKEETSNLGWVKRMITLNVGDYGTIKTTANLHDNHRNKCSGLYDPQTDTIWIDLDILSDKRELFTVVLHEVVHRLTGALDNTTYFTRGWEEACWLILNKGKGKEECKYLKQK